MKFWIPFSLVIICALVIVGYPGYRIFYVPPQTRAPADVLFAQGPYCFTYSHDASDDAPYTVSEYLSYTRSRDRIIGTKEGTQAGPDMTNGYRGSFEGTLTSEGFSGVYTYTVEGSTQKEEEDYVLTDTALSQIRYPLHEKDGVLVPDRTQKISVKEYSRTPCR